MRTLPFVVLVVLAAALVACSIDARLYVPDAPVQSAPDAPRGPFDCSGAVLPPVPESIKISGTVKDPVNGHLVAPTVTVEIIQSPNTPFAKPIPISVMGNAPVTFSTTGAGFVPRELFFRVSASGYKDAYYYPATQVAGDLDVTILLFTQDSIDLLAGALANMGKPITPDPSKAIVIITAANCNDEPLGGATITTTSSEGMRVYLDTGVTPNVGATQTDPTTGSAIFINASPSSLTVNASLPDRMLYGHVISAVANAVTQTEIQP